MKKRLLSLALVLVLTLSLASCSYLESIPVIGDLFGDQGGDDNLPDDGGQLPDDGDPKPGPDDDNPGGETPDDPGTDDPGTDDPGTDDPGTDDPVCDCWKDEDGDTICDNCGSGGLIPPELPPCEDGCKDANGDAICDVCGRGVPVPPEPRTPVVFLAGDSTVKTYADNQYIGGWGQFFDLFLSDEIIVKNAAHGGRSSRSFINEGRLYDIPGSSYSFSQNGGNSIADEIQAGDYLFIQFGHNDDNTKAASSYSTMYDRMVPLGQPDANGIYPVIPAEKTSTAALPEEYTSKATDAEEKAALAEIAKYGSEYYAYGSGTYKWYLKQYIDFAREKGAIPVLVTPVARVKFNSNGEIIGGAGLHGENFAYVQAVRQLAEEEDCLLIDLFADSKTMLESATSTYANFLMALKPNELTGEWPMGYDAAYGNVEAGYTGIEATHYNKYGAYLQAAFVAEHILGNADSFRGLTEFVNTTPESFIDPSNLIGRNTVAAVEALFTSINVTNPNRDYYDPQQVVDKIAAIPTEVTNENYLEIQALCEAARDCYAKVNVDDRAAVTNFATLEEIEGKVAEMIIANRPEPTKVVIFNADNLTLDTYTETVVEGEFTLVATADKKMDKKSSKVNFTYGETTYSMTHGLSVGGKATFGSNRYVSFTVDGPCTVTVAVRSSGSDTRTLTLVDSSKTTVGSVEAPSAVNVGSIEIDKAGTYSVGSAGSGMYIYMIIIEYFE